ncbi:MAG: hypothetical protein C4617_05445 [Candidatus Liberibacter europaeus]|uniref:Uncharacterized protein n=1 Tax=Candidatus Liberibacter europaeus TaxID=744859 RepID=A0A2T4VWD2_9HYPH|nr:MAG: hypothetical protein C4617_05445 [Candidatus Liberibacter europaeus]
MLRSTPCRFQAAFSVSFISGQDSIIKGIINKFADACAHFRRVLPRKISWSAEDVWNDPQAKTPALTIQISIDACLGFLYKIRLIVT